MSIILDKTVIKYIAGRIASYITSDYPAPGEAFNSEEYDDLRNETARNIVEKIKRAVDQGIKEGVFSYRTSGGS